MPSKPVRHDDGHHPDAVTVGQLIQLLRGFDPASPVQIAGVGPLGDIQSVPREGRGPTVILKTPPATAQRRVHLKDGLRVA